MHSLLMALPLTSKDGLEQVELLGSLFSSLKHGRMCFSS